jgi:hypothetical protein
MQVKDAVPLLDYPGMMLIVTPGPCHVERTVLAWVDGSQTLRRATKPLVVVTAPQSACHVMRDPFGGSPTLYLGSASFRLLMPHAHAIADTLGLPVFDSDE